MNYLQRNKKTKFAFVALICCFIVAIQMFATPIYIVANAQCIENEFVKADFSSDVGEVSIEYWSFDNSDWGEDFKSKKAELENYVKNKTSINYELVVAINFAFKKNNAYLTSQELTSLNKITLALKFNENVTSDFCTVVHLKTNKSQDELMALEGNSEAKANLFINSIIEEPNVSYVASNTINNPDNEDQILVSFDTSSDGIYLIYQIGQNGINIQSLIFIFGLILCVIIIGLLIWILIRSHKQKEKKKMLDRISKNAKNVVRKKDKKFDIDEDELEKRNLTRKIVDANETKVQQNKKENVIDKQKIAQKTAPPKMPRLPNKK